MTMPDEENKPNKDADYPDKELAAAETAFVEYIKKNSEKVKNLVFHKDDGTEILYKRVDKESSNDTEKNSSEAKPLPEQSAVNHPSHYNMGKYEVIDVINDWNLNFQKGNAVKYIARAGHKDPSKEIEDLEKALFYINYEVSRLKSLKGKEENTRQETDKTD